MANILKVNANPTKEFFIKMLTRDIDLQPAIAELVDNAIDGARKFRKVTDKELSIEVSFSDEEFKIVDTCGGISINDAQNYCFRFGRDPERETDIPDGTGVFGIGMKRALFRMGKSFSVKSVTPTEHFVMLVNVDEWLKDRGNDWSFKFDDWGEEAHTLEECGTEITVTNLYPSIKNSFANPYFRISFLEYIKRRVAAIKSLGLKVIVNNVDLQYTDERILFNEKYKPYIMNEKMGNVNICVVASCSKLGELKKAGWYVFCNNRMVLYANQEEVTGWGNGDVRSFHPAYAPFRGYVFFDSKDLDELPWNTTKTGVDTSSKYYQRALKYMVDATKQFTKYRASVDEFVKANDGISTDNVFGGKEISIFDEKFKEYRSGNHSFLFPSLNESNFPIPGKPMTNISFKVEKERADIVKNNLNVTTNKRLGEIIFQYYFEREIGEDE